MNKQLNLLIISSCVLLAGCANSNNTSNSKQPLTEQVQNNIGESETEEGETLPCGSRNEEKCAYGIKG